MSSNPFRRSKLPEQLPPTTPIATDAGGGEAPSKRTKKKRVKIQTPPDSPEAQFTDGNGARRLSAADASGRAGSPPPPATTVEESEEESDSTATADSELEEALKNTRRNSGSLPSPDKAPASEMRAPYNPFAKTLASSDAGFGLIRENAEEQGKEQRQGAGSGRAALDVDAFKNILLTGSATPSPPSSVAGATATPSAAPNTTFSRPHDSSSSNTDTSSIFDRNYGMQLESPRNSFDDYESASESDDDEKSGLMGQGRSDDLAPPAPPKPKIRGPQTVSFADFDQSIPEGFQSSGPRTPPVNTHITGILRPSTPRSSSDLNKPLPPPPAETYDAVPPHFLDKSLPPSQQPTPTITAEDATPKKAPPPPPTRRKAGDTARPRSSSNLSQEPSYPPDDDESTSKLAPPPPPARKPQPTAVVSGISSDPPSEKPSPSQSTTEVPKAMPPPPPRRHPSKTGPSPRHSESPAQRPGDAFLAAVAPSQPNAPPAPPPRRAGGSKRTSMDGAPDTMARRVSSEHSRPSGNSFDSDRSGFLSSLQQVAEPGENNEHPLVTPLESQRDVLADMTAFQAEIEALRLQSQNSR
ncbi:hypothetical protein M409DRAFT_20177 [Zasmidium cellare ATCC 36951]|uniref:Uncharacterized protein n=1 Tax=Zasmidium cellare ATCC 36951 TaxID=1080233 RepID=A0A6A6CVC2_ZASCE|nr:uncharacterized protein M409DRAFT_20177 [Zasmidium cellare ATCC 36951]KAF2169762.1 hypothetical protein M409DRAFT_20177 [Zasmidium cellare ATCC 36951]